MYTYVAINAKKKSILIIKNHYHMKEEEILQLGMFYVSISLLFDNVF